MDRAGTARAVDRVAASRWLGYGLAVCALALAPVAFASDRSAGIAGWAAAADVALGLALVASGLSGRPHRLGSWVSLIGAGWLLGSVVPQAATLSRGLLLLALLAFPTGLVRGRWGWWPYGAGLLISFPWCPQGLAAVVYLTAAWLLVRDRHGRSLHPFAGGVATAAGACQALGAAAAFSGSADLLHVASRGYQATLLAVAVGYPWAARHTARRLVDVASRSNPVDQSPGQSNPLARVGELLAIALGDPTLRVDPPSAAELPDSPGADLHQVVVRDGPREVAVIRGRSPAIQDPETARAASEAVRLVVNNNELLAQERRRVVDVAASRVRLVDAEDRERAALRSLLDRQVHEPIRALDAALGPLVGSPDLGEASETVDLVLAELQAALLETEAMLAGIPPDELGGGRIGAALADLGRRCPVPMDVSIGTDATGEAAVETMIYAVCAEAVTNALKHASANQIWLTLHVEGEDLVAAVRDDGLGGANSSGSGLQGLRDRVAARGGLLRIHGEAGAGTSIEVRVPARAQSIRW